MLSKTLFTVLTVAGVSLVTGTLASAQGEATSTTGQGGYASVNGLEMYYETHGSGDPLVLLHGGLGSSDMFAALVPGLAETHQVIVVDLQGHGRTALGDRPLSWEAMADDVAALIGELGLEHADVLGYSMGGGVALQTAIRHPEQVRRLVLVSTVFRRDGWYPEVAAQMGAMNADAAQAMLETPMYQLYSSVAPRPEDWPVFVSRVGELLGQDYDWTEQVAALDVPALIVAGDADSVQLPHALELFQMFGGAQADGGMGGRPASQFAVVPNALHWDILMRADLLLPMVTGFLNQPVPAA